MKPYVALLCCLIAALPAGADPCRRVSYSHGYTPSYAPTYYENNVVAVPVAIIPSTFYSVAPEIVTARLIAIASEDAARKAVAEYAATHAQPQPVPVPQVQGSVAPPPIPPAAQPQTRAAAPLGVAQKMVADNCATCHKPGSSRLQLDFAKLTRAQLAEVHFRLTTGSDKVMPPAGHKPVGEAELNAVDALLAATN